MISPRPPVYILTLSQPGGSCFSWAGAAPLSPRSCASARCCLHSHLRFHRRVFRPGELVQPEVSGFPSPFLSDGSRLLSAAVEASTVTTDLVNGRLLLGFMP